MQAGLRALKRAACAAECMRVFPPRKPLTIALALAALVIPALSGCSMGQPGEARAQAGMVGELVEQLKREDDENEAHEWAAMRQADEERREQEAEREYEWQ